MKESYIFFVGAVDQAVKHKTKPLAEYLRSNSPLDSKERDLLASFIDGSLARSRGRPRKRTSASNNLVMMVAAWDFEDRLEKLRKVHNRKNGLRDEALEWAASRHFMPFEKLNNFVRNGRHKLRRKRTK
jgi:hypothetical protein